MVEKSDPLEEVARHFAVEISNSSDFGGGYEGALEEVLPVLRGFAAAVWDEGYSAGSGDRHARNPYSTQ